MKEKMLKQKYFIKKQLSILMIGIMCIITTISGYAAEKLENDSIKARAVTSISKISTDEDGMITSGRWKCSNGIIIELTNNVLTISGKGEINEEARKIINSTICAGDKYEVNCIVENGITSIGKYVFSGTNLKSIDIPDSVTSIESGVFQGCENLDSIKIPNSVTSIEYSAFVGCKNLKKVEISNNITSIKSQVFASCFSLESIDIPDSVTNIDPDAFWDCTGLRSIEISANVTNIGERAFRGCSSLSSIKVAADNKVYDSRNNCNAIINTSNNELILGCSSTKIPNSVTSIGYGAFNGSGVTSIEIPSSVTIIGAGAFDCCNNLESIKIPNSVTDIGMAAFRACNNLRSIEIPSSVTDIRRWAFSCPNLSSIKLSEGLKSIDGEAFSGTVRNIEIPASVTYIGEGAFGHCGDLKKITNYSSVELELAQLKDKGQWYLENTNTIVAKIANGQTAVYRRIGEDGKPIDDVEYGDINSDGDINVQDGVLIKKYLAGIRGVNYNEKALDVNADGSVNSSDVVILLKYLAGMNVTIGK